MVAEQTIIFDDREHVGAAVSTIVGSRSYGEIIVHRRPLRSNWAELSELPGVRLIEFSASTPTEKIRLALERYESQPLTIIAGRSVPSDFSELKSVVSRLAYLGKTYFDATKHPLLAHFPSARGLLKDWSRFERSPIHLWDQEFDSDVRVDHPPHLIDISELGSFLRYALKGTEARHFNSIDTDQFTYTKSSRDKRKIKAEFDYYYLLPSAMQPWFVQPYSYRENETSASYEMHRYYVADASIQWIHQAWRPDAFRAFLEKINHYFRTRVESPQSGHVNLDGDLLFLKKVLDRATELQKQPDGRKIIGIFETGGGSFDGLLERYTRLYRAHQKEFTAQKVVIGHGDPCLSNILYDQSHMTLKLIDPRGASTEADLWAHPLYDYCKLSHSILGGYDFINHGLYDVGLNSNNQLTLKLHEPASTSELKMSFREFMLEQKLSWTALRLGESSLFLSMTPLHLDHPNKALAFLLRAEQILKEVENA